MATMAKRSIATDRQTNVHRVISEISRVGTSATFVARTPTARKDQIKNDINAMVQDGIKEYTASQKKQSTNANNKTHFTKHEESHATEADEDDVNRLNVSTAHMTIQDDNKDVEESLIYSLWQCK